MAFANIDYFVSNCRHEPHPHLRIAVAGRTTRDFCTSHFWGLYQMASDEIMWWESGNTIPYVQVNMRPSGSGSWKSFFWNCDFLQVGQPGDAFPVAAGLLGWGWDGPSGDFTAIGVGYSSTQWGVFDHSLRDPYDHHDYLASL